MRYVRWMPPRSGAAFSLLVCTAVLGSACATKSENPQAVAPSASGQDSPKPASAIASVERRLDAPEAAPPALPASPPSEAAPGPELDCAGAGSTSPSAGLPSTAEGSWKAVLVALQSGDAAALRALTTPEGCAALRTAAWGPIPAGLGGLVELGGAWSRSQIAWSPPEQGLRRAALGPSIQAASLSFLKTPRGFRLHHWGPGK